MADYHELLLKVAEQQKTILDAIRESGISVEIGASDIKIGAVEIQDSADDKRVDVENMNTGLEGVPANQKGMLVKAQIISADGSQVVDVSPQEVVGVKDDLDNRISPRIENGHGSADDNPSFVQFVNEIGGYKASDDAFKFEELDENGVPYTSLNPKPITGTVQTNPNRVESVPHSTILTVATPGSKVQFGSFINGKRLIIQAKRTNADSVFIGGTELTSSNGIELRPGETMIIDSGPTEWLKGTEHFVDALSAGDGIRIIYYIGG